MANNNYQHPPGLPFPFPYPQMQQMQQPPNGAHPDSQQQHAPPPPPGWNFPGLHQQQYPPQPQPHAPQPGHTDNQSNLPQFPPSALWPPAAIPNEWLQFMQSGMIPPPIPGLGFPPPSLPQTPQAPSTPIAFPPHFPPHFTPQPAVAPVERVHEVADSDREDGEVSDADASSRTPAGTIARQRYPEPPRSAPQPTTMPSRAEEAYNPDRPSAGQTTAHVSTPKAKPQPPTAVNEADLIQQQREEVKQFIRLLTSNNIGYHALAKENIDIELLRGMYQSMNLPSEPEPIPPPKTNGAAASKPSVQSLDNTAVTSAQSLPERSAPAVSTNVAAASAAGAAASPVDRKDYLARLQAAKLARQSAPAKASPPLKSPPAAVASPATGISTPQATATPTRKQPITDEQKARQTELIKQRLEALKAQSKQSVPVSNTAAQKPGPMPTTTQQPRTPGVNTPAQQSSVSSFPSIPGLFMNTPMKSGNGTTTPSRQPQIVPQKRPAQSDTETSTPRGSVTPYNRPFGQSPRAQQEESMIIEVSDDESNGSEMDIDDDQASLGPATIRQTPMSIPGFPPRQAPVPAAPSAVSTPGPQTPATLARTGELSTKEQELAALKQTLKRKLAEQKRIKEAAEAASAASSAAAASAAVPRTTPSKQPDTAQAPLQPAVRARETSASATTQSGSSTIDSSRDRKRRRRTEIQEQLPSLDDEIANNEAEMARLASDLERLKANNERIVKDKQRLIKELEDLGIDTEGMSHAELRATKNEIERATSPDVETRSQAVDVPSQSLPNGTSTGIAAASAESTTNVTEAESGSAHAPPAVISQPNAQYSFLPGLGQATPQVVASTASRPPPQRSQERSAATSHDVQAEAAKSEVVKDTDGPAIRDNSRASATPMDDDEDFYSPPPPADVQVHTIPDAVGISEPQVAQAVTDAPSPSEEGEIEMSESSEEEDEEEYEPDEPAVEEPYGEPQSQQAQMPDPQTEPSQGEPLLSVRQSQVSTEDEDAYEPPDVDEEMAEAGSGADAIQPETSSPGDADDGAMDIATSSSEDENDSDSDSDEGTQSESGDDVSQPIVTERNTNIADDLAPELQPGLSATLVPVAAPSDNVPVVEEEPEPAGFTPYESPLRMFKSYRYHPNYSQEVDGGFLSLTFSHQIDPEKPLCPFESAGGSCNDPECPNQHFRGMGITGEHLLVQLGTANPGKTQNEKQQWNDGLRNVLKELRQKNIKDPNGIAREIANYRRKFLNDDTRVVNL